MEIQNRDQIKSALESMMFVWGEPLSVRDAAAALELEKKTVKELFLELQEEYTREAHGIRVREVNGSFQFATVPENEPYIAKLCRPVKVRRLSQAALEVLAIIAYRQPVTRVEIDSIRGIKSGRVIESLMNRDMVKVCGQSDGIGRPNLYGTTDEFLKVFGFASLSELPDIGELENMSSGDWESADAEEEDGHRADTDGEGPGESSSSASGARGVESAADAANEANAEQEQNRQIRMQFDPE